MIVVLAGMTIAFSLYMSRSWMGFAFRAVGEDESAAATLGINAGAYKLRRSESEPRSPEWPAPCTHSLRSYITVDSFDFVFSVMLMAMVVIGGIGSTWGVVVAAIGLTLLPEAIRFVNDYRLLVFGGMLGSGDPAGPGRARGAGSKSICAGEAGMSAGLNSTTSRSTSAAFRPSAACRWR